MPVITKETDKGVCRGGADIEGVLRELTAIRADMVAQTAMPEQRLDEVHANYRDSARNLLHYLALRRHDLRPLQFRLAALGLSSLGRAESHVLATVDAVLEVLHRLSDRVWQPPAPEEKGRRFRKRSTPARRTHRRIAGSGDSRPRRPHHGHHAELRPGTTTPSFTTCWTRAWIACGSIALTTTSRRGCG